MGEGLGRFMRLLLTLEVDLSEEMIDLGRGRAGFDRLMQCGDGCVGITGLEQFRGLFDRALFGTGRSRRLGLGSRKNPQGDSDQNRDEASCTYLQQCTPRE